jgi:branched-subunit amino acid aminotransferase/4-amino-4-deoxychorismate lyase
MRIFLDGRWRSSEKAKLSINEPGFLFAQGVFETMRIDEGRIFALDAHINRLFKGLKVINMKLNYSKKELKSIVKQAILFDNYSPRYLKILSWQGDKDAHLALIVKKYEPYPEDKYFSGFKAIISSVRQNELSPLSNIKSLSRLHFLLAGFEAEERKVDEAILLNSKDEVSEGSRTNIFLIRKNILFTPDEKSGCLLGITRKAVLDIAISERIKVCEKSIELEELFIADEIFLTNSLIGIMPLTLINNKRVGKMRKIGKLTSFFRKKYQELILKGKV